MSILFENYLTRGFWGDEAWTALISSFPLAEIVRITGEDFHPPLYYFLVHGFIEVFGSSEMIRLLSTFFWIITPVPIYFLVRKLVNSRVALAAAIVSLTSPILFTYAFEARSYALVAFISAFSTLAFWNGLSSKKTKDGKQVWKWWVIYFLLGVAGVYTHYYMWFIFASHGFYWLLFDRKLFWRVSGTFGAILIVQLPWIPTLLSQVGSVVQDYWIGAIDKRTHWEFFVRVSGGDFETPQRTLAVWSVLLLLLASPVMMKLKAKRINKGYLFLWTWLLVPVLLPSIISLIRPVFFYRYLIFSIMPMAIIILWGLSKVRLSLAMGGAAYLVAIYLSINILGFQRYTHTMREELENIFSGENVEKIVTVLPSFAEVMYYNQDRAIVQVRPEGIVQFSGKSLLDAFVRIGEVDIAEPEEDEDYWLVEPGPNTSYHSSNN